MRIARLEEVSRKMSQVAVVLARPVILVPLPVVGGYPPVQVERDLIEVRVLTIVLGRVRRQELGYRSVIEMVAAAGDFEELREAIDGPCHPGEVGADGAEANEVVGADWLHGNRRIPTIGFRCKLSKVTFSFRRDRT
jgi:hypothetical protein